MTRGRSKPELKMVDRKTHEDKVVALCWKTRDSYHRVVTQAWLWVQADA
jgi:hypothetical protein